MCKSCWDSSSNRGLTLIEVVVSLALLSTLFVGVMVAFNRHAEQIRGGRKTLDAVRRLDALLYEWRTQGGAVPPDARGEFPGEKDLVWKTEVVSTRYRQDLGVDVVRMAVLPKHSPRTRQPLVTVDLLVPISDWPPEEPDRAQ